MDHHLITVQNAIPLHSEYMTILPTLVLARVGTQMTALLSASLHLSIAIVPASPATIPAPPASLVLAIEHSPTIPVPVKQDLQLLMISHPVTRNAEQAK